MAAEILFLNAKSAWEVMSSSKTLLPYLFLKSSTIYAVLSLDLSLS